jgi:hypothetical protein
MKDKNSHRELFISAPLNTDIEFCLAASQYGYKISLRKECLFLEGSKNKVGGLVHAVHRLKA